MHAVAYIFLGLLFLCQNLNAQEVDEEKQVALESEKQASLISAQAWLNLVDNGRYEESWDQGSSMLRRSVTKNEWKEILNVMRKSLGTVSRRAVVQQLPAQNPKNLPRGKYMVILYQTSFSSKSNVQELLTLSFESGQWKVITYHAQ